MQSLNNLIASKQASVYLILFSLIISAAMMHPGFVTLMIAVPINACILFSLRWVAHREGEVI
jgi:hypothetical protein